MSTTAQPLAAAAPTTKSRLSGHMFAVPGAALAILSFFLPWLSLHDGFEVLVTFTGLQIASGTTILSSEGQQLFSGSPIVYAVPVLGIAAIVAVILAFRRGYATEFEGFGLVGLSILVFLMIWGWTANTRSLAEEGGVSLPPQIGLAGTYLGLLVLVVAGGLYIRAVGARKPIFRANLGALGFMAPATFLITLFFFIPAIILLILSMTDLTSSNFTVNPLEWNFIGLKNYRTLFNDAFLAKIARNTVFYVVTTLVFFNLGLALLIALLTSNINRRAGFAFRVLWLLPRITPSVIYIVMWRRIVQTPPYGIINQFLGFFGVERQPYWLTETPWLFVILVNGLVGASFGLIIFASAIESIPKDLTIAAKVDGASTWRITRDITLPLMRWPLLFVTTYQTLSLLVSFEYILLLTEGGPGLFTTEVWALTAYKRALFTYFGTNAWGYGAAWGFILVFVGVLLSVVYLRVFRFNELVEDPKIDVL